MPRSVVLAGAERCPACRLPRRWCLCDALDPVETRLTVDILIHRREQWRPSSTGLLLARSIRGARLHVHRPDPRTRDAPTLPEAVLRSGGPCWVLHPRGEPLPDRRTAPSPGDPARVVLLDGNWREAGEMVRLLQAAAEGIGDGGGDSLRFVSLPMDAPGRYWIREAPAPGHRSTAEACLAILEAVGESEAAARLRLHFELHVWASLRARGLRARADAFLAGSPLSTAVPALIAALETPRPA